MVSESRVKEILRTYKEAWVNQDKEKILTIFSKDAVYHEKAFEKPFVGHSQIKQYWEEKVCKEQSDISFTLLNYYLSGDTVIAEWEASFFNGTSQKRMTIKEVAILETENGMITSLREYWHSKEI